jgi:hypothetical protein
MMRYQVELADQLGNLLARCTSKGLNPESRLPPVDRKQFSDDEHRLIDSLNHLRGMRVHQKCDLNNKRIGNTRFSRPSI